MGWLEGLLSGYAQRSREIEKDNFDRAQAANERESRIYETLLNSDDDWVRTAAGVGLLNSAAPLRKRSGIAGWLGEVEQNPVWPVMQKYLTTPQTKSVDVTVPGLPARRLNPATGLVTGLTPPDQSDPSAPPAQDQSAAAAADQPPPGVPAGAAAAAAAPDFSAGRSQVPPGAAVTPSSAPPAALPSTSAVTGGPMTAGQPAPRGAGAPAGLTPPPSPPPAFASRMPGLASSLAASSLAPVGPSAAAAGPPPPAPWAENVPAPAASGRTERQSVTTLPQPFPTLADTEANKAGAAVRGQIRELQEQFRAAGDPDWQRKGLALYQQMHGRLIPSKAGKPVQLPDGSWGLPIYNNLGEVINYVPATAPVESSTRTSSTTEQIAARLFGRPGEDGKQTLDRLQREPDGAAKLQQVQDAEVALRARQAGETTGARTTARYAAEKARVNPDDVTNAAEAIMSDASLAGVFLHGTQAYKDAVYDKITQLGGSVNKISDNARRMAEIAKDVLPNMADVAAMAKRLDELGAMGPLVGRWRDFAAGTIGVSDLGLGPEAGALAARFRTATDLLHMAVMNAHAGMRGAASPENIARMESMLSSARQDLPTFLNSMAGMQTWMKTYARHLPDWGTRGVEPGDAAPAPAGAPEASGPPAPAPAAKGAAAPGPGSDWTTVNGQLYYKGKPY